MLRLDFCYTKVNGKAAAEGCIKLLEEGADAGKGLIEGVKGLFKPKK